MKAPDHAAKRFGVLAPPSASQLPRELLLGRDLARLALNAPALGRLPRGDGGTVVCVAGFGTGDTATVPLRSLLGRLGHDARPAQLGRVSDDIEAQTLELANRVRRLSDRDDAPVALVGWSIGGIICREVARQYPNLVRRVVTFGTPVEGGPAYTALAWRYSAEQIAQVEALIERWRPIPITVPLTGHLVAQRRHSRASGGHRSLLTRRRTRRSRRHPHRHGLRPQLLDNHR